MLGPRVGKESKVRSREAKCSKAKKKQQKETV